MLIRDIEVDFYFNSNFDSAGRTTIFQMQKRSKVLCSAPSVQPHFDSIELETDLVATQQADGFKRFESCNFNFAASDILESTKIGLTGHSCKIAHAHKLHFLTIAEEGFLLDMQSQR